MEMPDSRKNLMIDLVELLQELTNMVTGAETITDNMSTEFTDSRRLPCHENDSSFKGLFQMIQENHQFQSNESIHLATRCLSVLANCPKTAESCSQDDIRFFRIYHNVAVIVLAISNFVVMTMLESATESDEDKKELEHVLKHVHHRISSNEQRFQEIADAMARSGAKTINPKIGRLDHISEQSGTDMQECTKIMQDLWTKRRISVGSTPTRKKSAWSLLGLGAVTVVDTGIATVTTGGINDTTKSDSLQQEIHRIQENCRIFVHEVEGLRKRFNELETLERDLTFGIEDL